MAIRRAIARTLPGGPVLVDEVAGALLQIALEPIIPTAALELSLTVRSGEVSAWTIRSHRSRPLFTFIDRIVATVAAATGDCPGSPPALGAARLAEQQNTETGTVMHIEQLTAHEYGTNHRIRHE